MTQQQIFTISCPIWMIAFLISWHNISTPDNRDFILSILFCIFCACLTFMSFLIGFDEKKEK